MQDKASLAEKLSELRGKYKSCIPWISPFPCRKCGGKIYGGDGDICRCCDPVERINALAEKLHSKVEDSIAMWWRMRAYIHAADIILESEK